MLTTQVSQQQLLQPVPSIKSKAMHTSDTAVNAHAFSPFLHARTVHGTCKSTVRLCHMGAVQYGGASAMGSGRAEGMPCMACRASLAWMSASAQWPSGRCWSAPRASHPTWRCGRLSRTLIASGAAAAS